MAEGTCSECGEEDVKLKDGKCTGCWIRAKKQAHRDEQEE
jgi:hypothetical protein